MQYFYILLLLFYPLHAHNYEEFSHQVEGTVQNEILNVLDTVLQKVPKDIQTTKSSSKQKRKKPFDTLLYEEIGMYDATKYALLKKTIMGSKLKTLLSPIPLHRFKTELEYMLGEYMYTYKIHQDSYLTPDTLHRLKNLETKLMGAVR